MSRAELAGRLGRAPSTLSELLGNRERGREAGTPKALECCPAFRMSMRAAFVVSMSGIEMTPPGWCRAGSWCSGCRGGVQSAVTSVTAVRVEDSSTMALSSANAATRAWRARLLTARG